jgi:hypothetical protein
MDLPALPDTQLPAMDLPASEISLPDKPSVPGIEEWSGINEYTEQAGNLSSSAKLEDLNVNAEKVEDQLTALDEVSGITEQAHAADQMKRYYDPEVAKEEALTKAKQDAVNHFAGHEEQLKAAMQQLSELKAKFPDTEGYLDLFAKRQRPLKGKPLIERFTPGITFQFQHEESFWLDLNPHVAFTISRRLSAGLGWNERIAYNFKEEQWDKNNHIYGVRSFVHFKVKSSFYLKADVECMNASLLRPNNEIVDRGWVWSFFAGVKKDFQLSRSLTGNIQMLYNLYNPENRSPYASRFNARLGIDIPLKARRSKSQS